METKSRLEVKPIMIILRDEKRIKRMGLIAKITSYGGMAILLAGLVLIFVVDNFEQVIWLQLGALFVGWLTAQVGIYLTPRYIRSPRPDEVLDETIRKEAKNGRLYHYLLPAPHVLLTPQGVILFNLRPNIGKISVEGDKWRQSGGFFKRFFGQEPLGDPSKELEKMVEAMGSYIRQHAPTVEELPMGALIVFTAKNASELDLKESRLPAMHYTKVKGFLRQQKRDLLPKADYDALRAAFDEKAVNLEEATYEGDST
jgi:hypothetical protein